MDIISKRTRKEFQEFLVGYYLREIEVLFDNHDLNPKHLPEDQLPSGQRRSLVEKYYANINWEDIKDVRKVVNVYEEILDNLSEQIADHSIYNTSNVIDEQKSRQKQFEKFLRFLKKDGFEYNEGKLVAQSILSVELEHDAVDLFDPHQFNEYVERIKTSIEDDPALAIGSTKELVEAVLKTILTNLEGEEFVKADDVPQLLKKVQKALKLTPDGIDSAARGAEIVRILLSNLGSVVIKLAELRNLYGTGHGTEKKRVGMQPRHAKLAVGAGITLCTFLLDTFKMRSRTE